MIMDYDSQYDPDYVKSFTDAPVIGEADPWFQITGIMQNDIEIPSFIVQNGSNMNLDTMYGYGYQTVLIQDENVDLSQLQQCSGPQIQSMSRMFVLMVSL